MWLHGATTRAEETSQKTGVKERERVELCFLHFFPAVEQFENIIAAVTLEELAGFFVCNSVLLELVDVVGFLGEEYDAVNALSGDAGSYSHDLLGWCNGVPGFVWSADVEVHEEGLL